MDVNSGRELTIAARLAGSLEEQIVAGQLSPGQQLDERQIAERFGVSRTPVREALRQLASAGLVEMRPRRKAVVRRLDKQRMVQMFEVLASLESLAAECAARRMSAALLAALAETHDGIGRSIAEGRPEDYDALNYQFHRIIYDGAGNGYLSEQVDLLRQHLSPYRRWLLQKMNRMRQSHEEHGRILAALQDGDEARAADEMRRHVRDDDRFLDFLMAQDSADG